MKCIYIVQGSDWFHHVSSHFVTNMSEAAPDTAGAASPDFASGMSLCRRPHLRRNRCMHARDIQRYDKWLTDPIFSK